MPAVCATRASLITPRQLGSLGTALLGLEGGRAGDPELQSSSLLPTCSPAKGQCLYLYPLSRVWVSPRVAATTMCVQKEASCATQHPRELRGVHQRGRSRMAPGVSVLFLEVVAAREQKERWEGGCAAATAWICGMGTKARCVPPAQRCPQPRPRLQKFPVSSGSLLPGGSEIRRGGN